MTSGEELLPDPSRAVGCIIIGVQGQTHHLLTDQHQLPVPRKSGIWRSCSRAPGPASQVSQGSGELSEHWQAPSRIPTATGGAAGRVPTRKGQQVCK